MSTPKTPEETDRAPAMPLPQRERWLLRIMLSHDDLVPWIADHLDYRWIRHPLARSVAEARLETFRVNSWHGIAEFLGRISDDQQKQLITDVVSDRKPFPDVEKTLKGDPMHTDKRGILEHLRDEFLNAEKNALRAKNPDIGDEEFLRQQHQLRQLKKKPLASS